MRRLWLVAMMIGFIPAALAQSVEGSRAILSKDPLTPEQIAIYRTFLEQYDNGGEKPLHLANRTEALVDPDLEENKEPGSDACLKGVEIAWDKQATGVEHIMDPSLAFPGRIVLVDPDQQEVAIKANDPSKTMQEGKTSEEAVNKAFSTGLLTLSEIAFDKKHSVAVMSFSFWCGRTCGHGAILIFKKKHARWRIQKKPCVEWVS